MARNNLLAVPTDKPLPATDELLSSVLLRWYDVHKRDLPWRHSPGSAPDPYAVWLSEVMLQQTTVTVVKGFFSRFIDRWPTVSGLASAPLDEVLREWAGLGYYARARNLHKCAQEVVNRLGGIFPQTKGQLQSLPGIGEYTASAIAAIAYNQPEAAVDGNVERVVSRLFAVQVPLPESKSYLKALTERLVPSERPGDFAQALMDLGSTICSPRRLSCLICPLAHTCKGRALNIASTLPLKRAKSTKPLREGVAFLVVTEDSHVLLRRRAEKGLLGGMMEVPSTPWSTLPQDNPKKFAPLTGSWISGNTSVEHTFTHFHLRLQLWQLTIRETQPISGDGYRWISRSEIHLEALPALMRKILDKALWP